MNTLDSIESMAEDNMPKLYDSDSVKKHISDAFILFKSICKNFNKIDATNSSSYTLKS